MYTEEINKVALSSNDNKRVQTFNRVTTFPHRTRDFKVCEDENVRKAKEYSNVYKDLNEYNPDR